jgi:Spy/CpxP family protein refolding chaperone
MITRNVLVAGLVLISTGVFAQRNGHHLGNDDKQIEKMKTELALTDQQYANLKVANKKFADAQQKLKQDTTRSKETLRTERKRIHDERDAAVKNILTDEQEAKLKQMKENRDEKHDKEGKQSDRAEKLKQALALTDDQYAKVNALETKLSADKDKVKADKNLSEENRKAAMKKLKAERETSLKVILAPEQFTKWTAMKDEKKNSDKHGKHKGKH